MRHTGRVLTGQWWQFVTSPGFGGACAVVAALIALLAAGRTARVNRKNAVDQQWWTNVRWLIDRLDDDLSDEGYAATLSALTLMARRAPSKNETEYVQDVMEAISGSYLDADEHMEADSSQGDQGGQHGTEQGEADGPRQGGRPEGS